jgi:hypothetical protein
MKICILITSHRQLRELEFIPRFFECHNYLREHAVIIYHTNNPEIPNLLIEDKLAKVSCNGLVVKRSTQNSGYFYGNFEAIVDSYDLILEGNYDWVIKIHPDVFIVDEQPLLDCLRQSKDVDFIATKMFGDASPAFSSDFFAFRPQSIPKSLFEIYLNFDRKTENLNIGEEYLLYFEIKRQNIKHLIVERFISGKYHRDIDLLGLWHEHNLERVSLYLKEKSFRWLITIQRCMTNPVSSILEITKYMIRKSKGRKQDSLGKQLTLI